MVRPVPDGVDLMTLRAVLLELSGWDRATVRVSVLEDGETAELLGSPVQVLAKLDEYGDHAQMVSMSFDAGL